MLFISLNCSFTANQTLSSVQDTICIHSNNMILFKESILKIDSMKLIENNTLFQCLSSGTILYSCSVASIDSITFSLSTQINPIKVELIKINGQWQIIRGGKEFYVNGASANNFYNKVADFKGNAIRTYSVTNNTKGILDTALSNNLVVCQGLWIQQAVYSFDYNDSSQVVSQRNSILEQVKLYKNHPALLMWSIGNEAESKLSQTSSEYIRLWKEIGQIAKMIKQEDPNHLVSTTLASSLVAHVMNVKKYAPDIDILCVNSYYPQVTGIVTNLKAAGWEKPFLISEFGPRGTWNMNPEPTRQLPWGSPVALVEETSTEKAAIYKKIVSESVIAKKADGCLGSFAFLWGYQAHGEVLNWYGLFHKNGYSYGAVDELQYLWTGSYPINRAPVIASRTTDMLMNGKKAEDIIQVTAGSDNTASVTATDPDGDPLRYEWYIFKEGTADTDGSMPPSMQGLWSDNTKTNLNFKAPQNAGGYRLYLFVYDDINKKVASAAIPFNVL